jgi:hypothetical protein
MHHDVKSRYSMVWTQREDDVLREEVAAGGDLPLAPTYATLRALNILSGLFVSTPLVCAAFVGHTGPVDRATTYGIVCADRRAGVSGVKRGDGVMG